MTEWESADVESADDESRRYVTIADSGFFPHLYALATSLNRHSSSDQIFVVCVDLALEGMIRSSGIENLNPVTVQALYLSEDHNKRGDRSLAEFCWMLTPRALIWLLNQHPMGAGATYIDADLYFLRKPRRLEEEFRRSRSDIMITAHSFAPELDASATAGYFVVQYIPARPTACDGILTSWSRQCEESTALNGSGEVMGDQKYLQAWPSRFGDRVHILSAPELIQAPWNAVRYPYSEAEVYHFHGLRLRNHRSVWLGTNPIPAPTMRNVYRPYLQDLRLGVQMSLALGVQPRLFPPAVNLRNAFAMALARLSRQAARLWARSYQRL